MAISSPGGPAERIGAVPVREAGNAAVRWDGLIAEQEAYVEEKRDKWLTFVGDGSENSGEMLFKPYTHRWTQGYTERQYAKIHDFIRGAMDEYDDPYIAFLPGFTASTTTPAGGYRPPLDHFDQLKRSWSRGVRYELSHSMNADRKKDRYPAREWEYLQIWEPTTDAGYTEGGYGHMHAVVVCDGPVGEERFRSVMEKHVEKCEWAGLDAHDYEKTDIRPLTELNNPAAYLFKYLGKSWRPDDAPDYQRRFDALLHETGYRRFQPSDGAQRWMKPEESESPESWIFAGVGDGDDVARLREFEDAHEFGIAHEMGVSTYLAGYEAPTSVDTDSTTTVSDECSHDTWHRGRCLGCGITEELLVRGGPPPD